MQDINPRICHTCGASLTEKDEFCKTCYVIDQWMLAVETSSLDQVIRQLKEDDLLLVVKALKRLRDRLRQLPRRTKKRKNPQEFDFALQEIEKTTRGLELTSIEAVGVLETVKQSFVEEMFYEDYRTDDDEDDDDDD